MRFQLVAIVMKLHSKMEVMVMRVAVHFFVSLMKFPQPDTDKTSDRSVKLLVFKSKCTIHKIYLLKSATS